MAKGAIAKQNVVKKIQEIFGADFIGEVDKKIYVWANDGGAEKVQIAISLTCPKIEVSVGAAAPAVSNGGWDFDAAASVTPTVTQSAESVEITQEEQDNIAALLKKLGL